MPKPLAFWSYARRNDAIDKGALSKLRDDLSDEVEALTGEKFQILFDRQLNDWGIEWKKRLEEAINEVTFFIPILTPSFLHSKHCRWELQLFHNHEQSSGRNDLILPIYYIRCPELDSPETSTDGIVKLIASRQWVNFTDCREVRVRSPKMRKRISELALAICRAAQRTGSGNRQGNGRPRKQVSNDREFQKTKPKSSASQRRARVEAVHEPLEIEVSSLSKEPITVGPDRIHDFRTITEAIHAAAPMQQIAIAQGTYEEVLVVDRPVMLSGEGASTHVVVLAVGAPPLTIRCNWAVVENLCFKQRRGIDRVAIDIYTGDLRRIPPNEFEQVDIRDCDVATDGHAAIRVNGYSSPRILRTRIDGGRAASIYLGEAGKAELYACDVCCTGIVGVHGSPGSHLLCRQSRIESGKNYGVFIAGNARATLNDNDLAFAGGGGIALGSGGFVDAQENRFKGKSNRGAIRVRPGGEGVFKRNDLRRVTGVKWDLPSPQDGLMDLDENVE